jgi:hypothetical protein
MKSKRHMKAVELKKKWHPDIVKWGVEPNHEEMEKAKKDRQFYRSGVRKYTLRTKAYLSQIIFHVSRF